MNKEVQNAPLTQTSSGTAEMLQDEHLLVDPAHDILRSESLPLDAIFKPKSVALIGASERTGSVGRMVLSNLISTPFGGTIYPVNPKRSNILGIRAYKNLQDLPERPDLIVVTTPSDTVPALDRGRGGNRRTRSHRHLRRLQRGGRAGPGVRAPGSRKPSAAKCA